MSSYFSLSAEKVTIPELNGLRGIAILLVFLRHAAHPFYIENGEVLSLFGWDLAVPFLNGWMGVDLFFVLSGFLICHHLMNRWPDRFDIGFLSKYWAKRILRTFPAYYAAVAIALLGLIPMYDPDVPDIAYTLKVHLLFLQEYMGSELVPAFWSLGVEEKFYLVCPFVLWMTFKLPPGLRIGSLLSLAFLPLLLRLLVVSNAGSQFADYTSLFWTVRAPFHLATDGLWVGVISALLYRNGFLRGSSRIVTANRVCVAALALVLVLMLPVAWLDSVLALPTAIVLNLVALSFGILVLAASSGRTFLGPLLRSRCLMWLSTLSYSIYLVHMMLIPLARHIVVDVLRLGGFPIIMQIFAMTLVLGILSLFVAALLHFAVEKPCLRLKDRIQFSPAQRSVRPQPSGASIA